MIKLQVDEKITLGYLCKINSMYVHCTNKKFKNFFNEIHDKQKFYHFMTTLTG